MPAPRKIDIERMRELFEYDPESGGLFWKKRNLDSCSSFHAMISFNNKKAGSIAGSKRKNRNGKTYLVVKVDDCVHLVHRICYSVMTGSQPEFIDHVNGDGTDNKWTNIRNVSVTENNRNMRLFKTNTSGFVGVSKCGSKWQSNIWVNNKQIKLGVFDTKAEAVAARIAAEKVCSYHENHGSERDL